MSKIPAFQFYPADWRKDPGVQALSFHDRGVWFEILCLMHESEQRGKLLLGGQPMPDAALARLLGLDKQNLINTLSTLIEYGVASRDTDSGALVSRRMLRDDELRKIRKEVGKKGGNPNLVNQNQTKATTNRLTKLDNQNSTPSSSSSNIIFFERRNNIKKEKTILTNSPKEKFQKPTLNEVIDYGIQICSSDAEACKSESNAFIDYYESNGWRVGKNQMKDWRAAFRNWYRNSKNYAQKPGSQRKKTFEEIFNELN